MDNDLKTSISSIYADDSEQINRYARASQHFKSIYGAVPSHIFRAPGRVNLIGEHTDYNHGYVMPVALDKDVLVFAKPRTDSKITLNNIESTYPETSFDISKSIPKVENNQWGNYARGVAQVLANSSQTQLKGFDALIVSEAPFGVPTGAGLSSSSALTVVLLKAFSYLNDYDAPISEMVTLASDAEWYLGTRGGIMDQFISLAGKQNTALFLDCRPDSSDNFQTETVTLDKDYRLLIINSGVKHQNVGGGYNYRVAACRAGVGLLQKHYPEITHLRDMETIDWESFSGLLPDISSVTELQAQGIDLTNIPTIEPETQLKVKPRCKHVWSENKRVLDAVKAIKDLDMHLLGQLMNRAHVSARDDYEISCPEIEVLITSLNKKEGVLGSRLTGAGWGGCVVALVQKEFIASVSEAVGDDYRNLTGLEPTIFPCQASDGASLVWQS